MKIYELLATPDKWTKGANAKNESGKNVSLDAPDAVSFCLLGAIRKCYDNVYDWYIIVDKIHKETHNPIPRWNDAPERTHAEVLELVTKLDI